jgi:glycosyltransferase involved in cell wall biosynthesis
MRLSVVIPVKNDLDNIKQCVAVLERSEKKPHEVIVVDDASSVEIKGQLFCQNLSLIRLESCKGPAYARNAGARIATGDVVVFLDSDIFVEKDTLLKIDKAFQEEDADAVVGVLEDSPKKNFFSDYKNLWMRYTYENAPRKSPLFFSSIAAIRRDLFLQSGGFNESITRPGIEDTFFGNVLWEQGVRPQIDPGIQVFHNKTYTLRTLMKTDFARSLSLTRMKLEGFRNLSRRCYATSIPWTFTASVLCAAAGFCFFIFKCDSLAGAMLVLLAIVLNVRFLRWLYQKRGFLFFLKAIIFITLDYLVILAGVVCGFLDFLFKGHALMKLKES